MASFTIDIEQALDRLRVFLGENADRAQPAFVKSDGLDLDILARLALEREFTIPILEAFYPLFPDIAARWVVDGAVEETVIAAAFARTLPLIPHIAVHADAFFYSHGWHKSNDLQHLVSLYRLLVFDKTRFENLVDTKDVLDIITGEYDDAQKYIAIILWALHSGLSDEATNALIKEKIASENPILGNYEGVVDVDYLFFLLLEAKRLSTAKNILSETDYSLKSSLNLTTISNSDLSSLTANLCGVLVPRYKLIPVVYTQTTVYNIRRLATVLRSSDPLLISGPPGSGKTLLIDHILSMLSRTPSDIVKLHLGDQTDTKILVGSYSTGETPGSFVWKQGVLATAVQQGKVVVVEDIDKAPNEVISTLLSLVQQRQIAIPSRGETIRAGRSFQIIATVTETAQQKNFIGKELWQQATLTMMSDMELEEVVAAKFDHLRLLAPLMRRVYSVVRDLYRDAAFLTFTRGAQNRIFSSRDLMKWARRVSILLAKVPLSESSEGFSPAVYDSVFCEAVDCFAGSVRIPQARALIVGVIGNTMNVAPHIVQHYLNTHVPDFTETAKTVSIGRITLPKLTSARKKTQKSQALFAHTKHTLRLLEQIATCVSTREPLLLVGETGTGKTTVIQQLASSIGTNIVVLNVSQQTEAADLLGGYKPVDVKSLAIPLQEEFENLFERTFSSKRNERFNVVLGKAFGKGRWKNVTRLWKEAVKMADSIISKQISGESTEEKPSKKRRLDPLAGQNLLTSWDQFSQKVNAFDSQYQNIENSFVYQFIEGALVRAVRNGDWVLLDEINLAAPDTLESIADLLVDGGDGACLQLSEKGDTEAVRAHPNFRIFACMNPATDVGKRDLPAGFRARFTEVYVGSPDQDPADLLAIIEKYIGQLAVGQGNEGACQDVAEIYTEAKRLAEDHLIVDGANQKPHFSIRTLTRTLVYVRDITPSYGLRRALYEGFCMAFLTLLDRKSEQLLLPVIMKLTIGKLRNPRSVLAKIPSRPSSGNYIQFKHYWLEAGPIEPDDQEHYIITPFVEKNMLNLVRAVTTRRFPVLVQGPTSSGKTSMISYLAKKTGHKFVRINNHEHTDLQEYLGSYVSDSQGNLRFQEGVLVEAARNGSWLVLDELNLAPTDVLEALNRLLDDNREIFIPETQEVVVPHPHFLLFASQNPPGLYGGRKNLSRAFRNRFLELHFDDIPEDELETILKGRCQIPPSYAKRIVEVYKELSVRRQSTRIFEKNGFATLRDLFRWANREAVGYEQLALNGYLLLAERVRQPDEQTIVKEVIQKVMRVKLDIGNYYSSYPINAKSYPETVWNKSMRRLFALVSEALKNREPVLLVGETGCGKTTICQILAQEFGKKLHIVNAHQNTEASDIIGAQRPLRNRSEIQAQLIEEVQKCLLSAGIGTVSSDLDELLGLFDSASGEMEPASVHHVNMLRNRLKVLFEWCDGSLVQALRQGDFFLLDEISLTDDSVLERLNSVLEQERSILLAEKGVLDSTISAADGFQFLATMNPSGDYGKKELSPALRNRFTEIWVPAITDMDDVYQIVRSKLDRDDVAFFTTPIVKFASWFSETYSGIIGGSSIVSLRDVLTWISFINSTKSLSQSARLLHGAAMVFIDTLGTNTYAYLAESTELLARERQRCVDYLSEISETNLSEIYSAAVEVSVSDVVIKAGMFEISRIKDSVSDAHFSFSAPTTAFNAMRIIRGMQLRKPLMLEGSPGVGKTSIMTALAAAAGAELTRINLSDQTDLMDLFGSDSPVEGGASGEFVWRDAPFLHAMQHGQWVLLDEMNLASQSVLEGLNACLDHRAEAYVPELDRTFYCHPNFKVFAAQNSHYQGGGRKGLPKSFVNRFTVVYMDILTPQDLSVITSQMYPNVDTNLSDKIISFISALEYETSRKKSFGRVGAPWEFNLRDTIRWFQLLERGSNFSACVSASEYMDIVVTQRFRTPEDRLIVEKMYEEHFQEIYKKRSVRFILSDKYLQVGHSVLPRAREFSKYTLPSDVLTMMQCNLIPLETLMTCVDMSWPAIIIGPPNSGKTSLIRILANLIGARLEEFAISSDVDSMDIVGGFEQVDLSRQTSKLWQYLHTLAGKYLMRTLKSSNLVVNGAAVELFDLTARVEEISVAHLDHALNLLGHMAEVSIFQDEIGLLAAEIENLKNALNDPARRSPLFEWFDGILVRALERGDWLVLDNANLCGPSVLDRLNSLLEHNGVLVINERSLDNGELNVIRPHPNFRLFLTVDPHNGELSRAMRNRGVEIFLDDLENRASNWDREVLKMRSAKFDNSIELQSDLHVEFDKLSLVKPHYQFSTLMSNYPTSNALLRAYGLLDGLPNTFTHVNKYLAISAVDYLPIASSHSVTRWSTTLGKLEFYSNAEKSYAVLVSNLFMALCQSNLASVMSGFYASIAFPEYGNYQSYYASSNPYGISYYSKAPDIDSTLSGVYDIIMRLLFLRETITEIEQRAEKMKLPSLDYIERSAAAVRRSKSLSPSKDIFLVLKSGVEAIQGLISHDDLPSFSKDHLDILSALLDFVDDILELTHNVDVEETQLPIYRDIAESLVYNIDVHDLVKDTAWNRFKQYVGNFGSKIVLTSGKSIEIIWRHARPKLPNTRGAWTTYLSVLELSRKLDEISSTINLDNQDALVSLQHKLIDANRAILERNDVESVEIKELDENVQWFLSDAIKTGTGNKNIWENVMSIILMSQKLHATLLQTKPETKDDMVLANWARRDLEWEIKRLRYADTNFNGLTYLLLCLLFGDNVLDNSGSEIFTGDVASELITAISSTENGRIEDIMEIGREINLSGSILVSHSAALINKKLPVLMNIIIRHMHELVNIHENSEAQIREIDSLFCSIEAGSVTLSQVDNFESYLQLSSKETILLIPILRQIISIMLTHEPLNPVTVGNILVKYAAVLLHLYVPSIPYDPAIKPYVEKRRLENKFTRLSSWLEAAEVIEQHIDGSGTSLRVANLKLELASHSTTLPAPVCYRPDKSQSNLIFQEIHRYYDAYIGGENVDRLLSDISVETTRAVDVARAFQRNSRELINRLRTQFPIYTDLFEPLECYVYFMKLGVGLISNSKTTKGAQLVDFSWLVDFTAIRANELVNITHSVQKIVIDRNLSQSLTKRILACLLEWTTLRLRALRKPDEVIIDTVNAVLKQLYYHWSLNKARVEADREANSTVFKPDTAEEEEDQEFKQMFPDYDHVISIENSGKEHEDFETDSRIFNIFVGIYDESHRVDAKQDLIERGLTILHEISKLDITANENLVGQVLPAIISQASTLAHRFNNPSAAQITNFYTDRNIAEARKAAEICASIKVRLDELVTRWPENEALKDSLSICQELLDLPTNTPVAKLLNHIEKELGSLHEWQKVASREFSVTDHIDALNKIVIEWRRLELASWPSLFDREVDDMKNKTSEWLFFLYENIIAIPLRICEDNGDIEAHVNELLQAITAFFGSSPKGQFSTRLQLVRAFASHARRFGDIYRSKFDLVAQSLYNTCQLYEIFLPKIEDSLKTQRKPLEKEISEIILLASWKDTNFIALKESARRSHHKLYKIVRKFRAVLSQPARTVFDEGLGNSIAVEELQIGSTREITTQVASQVPSNALEICADNIEGWNTRPERLIDLDGTAKLLRRYATQILDTETPRLTEFTIDLVREMQDLRKETPSELSDENKSAVQFLKARKTKLLSDSFKELKRMGLKYRVRPDVVASQDSVTKILASTYILLGNTPAEFNGDFFRVLEMLPRVRSCATNHSEDLTPPQVQRGLGLTESLAHLLISQRVSLYHAMEARQSFSNVVQEFTALTSVSEENTLAHFDLRGDTIISLSRVLRLCCSTIDFAHSVALSHGKLSNNFDIEVVNLLGAWRERLTEYSSRLDTLVVPKVLTISTRENASFVEETYKVLEQCYSELLAFSESKDSYGYIINIVLRYLSSERVSQANSFNVDSSSLSAISELDHCLRGLCDSILVVIQSIHTLSSPPLSTADDNWVTLSSARISKSLQSLHYSSIANGVKECLAVVNKIAVENPLNSAIVSALVSLAMPLIHEYDSFAEKLILNAADDHVLMAKSSLALLKSFYTVARSGYCTPQEPSEDDNESGTQQGTGLGDGEGDENISKTVGNDEDLTDYANQPESNEKDEKDKDEEEDAVDMEGDMEGETEDLDGEKKDGDKSDDDDEDDAEELDEEVGDVDNLDPSAVDEKMWDDGNADDDSKEKNTDDSLKDSTLTDDLAAKTKEDAKPESNESADQQDEAEKDDAEEEEEEDEEEGAMDQQDDVRQQDQDDLEPLAPEGDALDLPEDMNLDNDDDSQKMDEENDDGLLEEDPLDKPMDMDDKNDLQDKVDDGDTEQQENDVSTLEPETEPNDEENGDKSDTLEGEDMDEDMDGDEEVEGGEMEDDENAMDIDKDENEVQEAAPDNEKEEAEDQENNASKSEGLHGPEEANEDVEQAEAALNGGENSKTEGEDTDTQEASKDTTAQENGSAAKTEETRESKTSDQQAGSEETRKRLGDSSEEWHRQSKDIQEAEGNEKEAVDEKAKQESADEYRHLDDSEATYDTQALGIASNDQRNTIEDDAMAVDDEQEPENNGELIPEEAEQQDGQEEESASRQQQYAGGIIGERQNSQAIYEDISADQKEDEDVESAEAFTHAMQVDAGKEEPYRSLDAARDVWQEHERATQDLSNALSEQLRLILEPTLSTKLRGDFRTGKRLNMKRIIPYIASQYKKDKIWLRRTKPSKREYQIMISLDDSRSMSESQSVGLAFDTIALVTKALERLESGQISIVRFGETCEVVHPFQTPFTSEAGAQVFRWFGFEQTRTDVHALVEKTIDLFDEAKSDTKGDMWQLELIISDGLCEDHESLRRQVRRAREKQIMLVFIIVDGLQKTAPAGTEEKPASSILELSQVSYATDEDGQMSLQITKYLSSFPFEFYVIVRNIAELPSVLALVLRQYFAEIAELQG